MDVRKGWTLTRGDRVMWGGDPNDLGTVHQVTALAVRVRWDDGTVGTFLFSLEKGWHKLELAPPPKAPEPEPEPVATPQPRTWQGWYRVFAEAGLGD